MALEEIKALPITLDTDFSTLNVKVQEAMKPFQAIIVSSGTVGDAKLTRAELNKVVEAIDQKRKEVKKAYLAPLDAFEAKIKELIYPVQLASTQIDTQIKNFENEEKEAKKVAILSYFQDLNSPIDVMKVWKTSWLNATCSEKQWKADIDEIVQKVNTDLTMLSMTNVDDPNLLRNLYLETLDALIAVQRYESLKAVKTEPLPLFDLTKQPKKEEPLSFYSFSFFTTESKMNELLKWCDENKVSWEESK